MDSACFFALINEILEPSTWSFFMEIVLQILHSVFLQVKYRTHASILEFDVTSGRMQLLYIQKSRHTAVGVATKLWAGIPRFQFLMGGGKSFSPLHYVQARSGIHRAFRSVFRDRNVKLATHLPSSAEVKNGWSSTFSPPPCLHGMHKENFTSVLPLLFHLEDPGIGRRIIRKVIFKKSDGGLWIGLIWLGITTGGGLLSMR